ncbi:SRPBCC family protein [Microbacterium deminutum]|uniref:SRPBCC family protein n=1 Tax=Microbacterium deminutum TaxID=344164 RepID=A0ABN2R2H3_9MICO
MANGWLYPSWVVGATRMRDVDVSWPEPGSQLRHSLGVWPALINDETHAIEWNPPHRMRIRPTGWPLGEALVTIDVKARASGCVVRIQEEAVAGPVRWIPRPLIDILLWWRNTETLHRLAYLAEGIPEDAPAPTTAEREASGDLAVGSRGMVA